MSDQLPGGMNEHEPSMEDILASIRELIAEDSPPKISETTSETSNAALINETSEALQDFDLDVDDELSDGLKGVDFEQSQIFGRIVEDEAVTPDITADLGDMDIDDSSTKDFLASAGFDLDEDLTRPESDVSEFDVSEFDVDEMLLGETLDDPNIALSNNSAPIADISEANIMETGLGTGIESFDEDMDLTALLDDGAEGVAENVAEDVTGTDEDLLNTAQALDDAQAQDDIVSEIFDDIDAIAGGEPMAETAVQTGADFVDIEDVLSADNGFDDTEIDFDAIFSDDPISRPGVEAASVEAASVEAASVEAASVEAASVEAASVDKSTIAAGAVGITGIAAGLAAGLGANSSKTNEDDQRSAPELDISELEDFNLSNLLQDVAPEVDTELGAELGDIDPTALDLSDALDSDMGFGDSLEALLPEVTSQDDAVTPQDDYLAMDVDALDAANGALVEADAADEMTLDELIGDILGKNENIISAPSDQDHDQNRVIDSAVDLIESDELQGLALSDEGDRQGDALDMAQIAQDDDINLVKSLMADLTDDSFEIDVDELGDEALVENETLAETAFEDISDLEAISGDEAESGSAESDELGLALDEELPDIAAFLSEDGPADMLPENESEASEASIGGLEALVAASAAAAVGASLLGTKPADTGSDPLSAPLSEPSSDTENSLDKAEQTDLDSTEIGNIALEELTAPPRATSTADNEIDNLEDKTMPHIVKKDTVSSVDTVEAASGAFASLNKVVEEKAVYNESGPRIGDLVQEALRPMLQEWLDKNLKGIVDRAVSKEIKRISSGK